MSAQQAQAVTITAYGGPEVLQVKNVDVPDPGSGQVRVAVRAAGINPWDLKLVSGSMADSVPVGFPFTPGGDIAGVIEAIGPDVTALAVGDEVAGNIGDGGWAELIVVDADKLSIKPAGVSWPVAAAAVTPAQTAAVALESLGIGASDVLLVHGASGAVGKIAVQLAIFVGATVIGTSSDAKAAQVQALGATAVPYGDDVAAEVLAIHPGGVTKVLDTSGHDAVAASLKLVSDPHNIISIVDFDAPSVGARSQDTPMTPARLAGLLAKVAGATLMVTVDAVFPLDQAAAAFSAASSGAGKVVFEVR